MRQTLKCVLVVIGFLMALKTQMAFADTKTLTLETNQRLEASIAKDAMNRLAVSNDRIVNVFGDEGTFVTQTDDETGQVFIKPSIENGTTPLSVTIITENNITQDLILNPTDKTAATLILRTAGTTEAHFGEAPSDLIPLPSSFPEPIESKPAQLIHTMRKAVLGELAPYAKKGLKRQAPQGFKLVFDKAFQSGSFVVSVWRIKGDSNTQKDLTPKNFTQKGDLALSIQSDQGKTLVYALGRL